MDVTDVEPLLLHLSSRQQAVVGQRALHPAFPPSHHPPVGGALYQEEGVVRVREIRSVQVTHGMVTWGQGGKQLCDFLRRIRGQLVSLDAEPINLGED